MRERKRRVVLVGARKRVRLEEYEGQRYERERERERESTHSDAMLCIFDTSLLVDTIWNMDGLASLHVSVDL